MVEVKESRDTATSTEQPSAQPPFPNNQQRTAIIPVDQPPHPSLTAPHPRDLMNSYHIHSPTSSGKSVGLPYDGRSRSHSLGSSSPTLHQEASMGDYLPGLPLEPPRVSDTQKIIEAAVQNERKRAKDMQATEKDMTADELRFVLKRERQRMFRFVADLAKLRNAAVQCQAEAEIHEEGRINGLMRRLESLQIEKGRIIIELEREEEMLTNTLQKKLNEVRREKEKLEKVIAQEQLHHSNLQSKLTGMRDTKSDEVNPLGSSKPVIKKNSFLGMGSLAECSDEEEEEEEEEEGIEEVPTEK